MLLQCFLYWTISTGLDHPPTACSLPLPNFFFLTFLAFYLAFVLVMTTFPTMAAEYRATEVLLVSYPVTIFGVVLSLKMK